MLAVVLGSIITNKILYASSSLALKAKVHSKVTHRERSAHSKSYSSAFKIIYQFENPYVADKIEIQSELAPLLYSMVVILIDLFFYNSISDQKLPSKKE